MVFSAIGCLALLGVGSHLFLSWLYRSSDATEGQPRVWARRWTVAILSVLMLMFTAGISVVGATHQTIWLMTSPEPMIVNRNVPPENYFLARAVRELIVKSGHLPPEQIRREAQAVAAQYEQFHFLLVDGPDRQPAAVVAFHRDKHKQERHGLYARSLKDKDERYEDRGPLSELHRVLGEIQTAGMTKKMQADKEQFDAKQALQKK